MVKMREPYANRPECKSCVAEVNGRCMALAETQWIKAHHECPFYASPERIERDKELLAKAIKEGRVNPDV